MTYFLRNHKTGMELRCDSKWRLFLLHMKGYRVMYEIKDFNKDRRG